MSDLLFAATGTGLCGAVVAALNRWPGRAQLYRRIGAWWIMRAVCIEAAERAKREQAGAVDAAAGVVRG